MLYSDFIKELSLMTNISTDKLGFDLTDFLNTRKDGDSLTLKVEKDFPIKAEHIDFMRNYVIDGKLKISKENAEMLFNNDPCIFQGIELEFIDENDNDFFEES